MTGLTPNNRRCASMLQTTRSDIRLTATAKGVRALAAIIVAKKRLSQAGTAVMGIVEQRCHDKNITKIAFFSYR
jgi:ribosomal protein L14